LVESPIDDEEIPVRLYVTSELDYDSEVEGWEASLIENRAEEVVAIKKEESPIPEKATGFNLEETMIKFKILFK
jgi:hypothetical protein